MCVITWIFPLFFTFQKDISWVWCETGRIQIRSGIRNSEQTIFSSFFIVIGTAILFWISEKEGLTCGAPFMKTMISAWCVSSLSLSSSCCRFGSMGARSPVLHNQVRFSVPDSKLLSPEPDPAWIRVLLFKIETLLNLLWILTSVDLNFHY